MYIDANGTIPRCWSPLTPLRGQKYAARYRIPDHIVTSQQVAPSPPKKDDRRKSCFQDKARGSVSRCAAPAALANKLRIFGLLVAAMHGLSSGNGAVAAVQETTSEVEQFKDFLASPPAISDLVALVTDYHYFATGTVAQTRVTQIRWQPECLFYREVPTVTDVDAQQIFPGYPLVSRFRDSYWLFTGQGEFITTARKEENTEVNQSISRPIKRREAYASRFVMFGIHDSAIGGVRWSGASLVPFTNFTGMRIEGSLELGAKHPKGIDLIATDRSGQQYRWTATYEYAPNSQVPPFLPSKVRAFSGPLGGPLQPKGVYEILSLSTSGTPLGVAAFSLERFMRTNTVRIIQTNDVLMFEDPWSKTMKPVLTGEDSYPWKKRLIWWLLLGGIVFFSISVARNIRKTKEKKGINI